MTVANDSILVTPGSGATVATHTPAGAGKEYQVVIPADDFGHLWGTVPAFAAITPSSAFGANKFQFVLYNPTASGKIVRVWAVIVQPGVTTVTGVLPSEWTLQRREAPATPPSGAGAITPAAFDSGQPLTGGITAHNAPGTAPAGGTVRLFLYFRPQPDEVKLSTLDAPTFQGLQPFGGMAVYLASMLWPATPIVLRENETLEVQQTGTAGTGNCRVFVIFTIE